MHKEKVLGMSHKGFFINTKGIYFLGIVLGC